MDELIYKRRQVLFFCSNHALCSQRGHSAMFLYSTVALIFTEQFVVCTEFVFSFSLLVRYYYYTAERESGVCLFGTQPLSM